MTKHARGQLSLGAFDEAGAPREASLGPGATLLRGFALPEEGAVLEALAEVVAAAPFRHMLVPGGGRMSVAMTNCGALGWVSDLAGYRYDRRDPTRGLPWPEMPTAFVELATTAASAAGFGGFVPDACLVNRYEPGARLALHQDKDELDFAAPIVSVSLGISAVFLFGGAKRSDPAERVRLTHGDVVVWGGPARLRYHGVLPVQEAQHARCGPCRFNLTFRKAG